MGRPPAPCDSVCSLPPAELAERLAMIRSAIAPLVRARRVFDQGREWRFDADSTTRARLEHLVELERRCCATLSFELRSDGGTLVLSATGPGAAELFQTAGL